MNIVYKIEFVDRKKANIQPYYYIGSKSNCSCVNGDIIDNRGRVYYGSSTYPDYELIVEESDITVSVLGVFDVYRDALRYERKIQIEEDVVVNELYFNRSIATENNFTDPNYASYKHRDTGVYVRLRRDHPLVVNGTYVGNTHGRIIPEEERKRRGRSGSDNAFYGKSHSDETKKTISEKAKQRGSTPWNNRSEESKNVFLSMARKPKTADHKSKIGRKGLVMLVNIFSREIVRVLPEDVDPHEWYDLSRYRYIRSGDAIKTALIGILKRRPVLRYGDVVYRTAAEMQRILTRTVFNKLERGCKIERMDVTPFAMLGSHQQKPFREKAMYFMDRYGIRADNADCLAEIIYERAVRKYK